MLVTNGDERHQNEQKLSEIKIRLADTRVYTVLYEKTQIYAAIILINGTITGRQSEPP